MSEAEDLMNKCCLSKCRGHALEAENKRQADFLSLAKEQMDASQAEKARLRKLMKGATLDYGYANGWSEDPLLVKECKEKGHKRNDRSIKPFGHDNIVWCDICRYQYKYNSS